LYDTTAATTSRMAATATTATTNKQELELGCVTTLADDGEVVGVEEGVGCPLPILCDDATRGAYWQLANSERAGRQQQPV
jgi:hypothetical protein